jgi:hypothetical protein
MFECGHEIFVRSMKFWQLHSISSGLKIAYVRPSGKLSPSCPIPGIARSCVDRTTPSPFHIACQSIRRHSNRVPICRTAYGRYVSNSEGETKCDVLTMESSRFCK